MIISGRITLEFDAEDDDEEDKEDECYMLSYVFKVKSSFKVIFCKWLYDLEELFWWWSLSISLR